MQALASPRARATVVPSLDALKKVDLCPACGSSDLTRIEPRLLVRLIGFPTFGMPFSKAFHRSRSCKDCAWTIGVAL